MVYCIFCLRNTHSTVINFSSNDKMLIEQTIRTNTNYVFCLLIIGICRRSCFLGRQ